MHAPLVSIIIPCYNAEQYVGEAIQSALQQTYRHKEVIVIDDGSKDSSVKVIQSFGNLTRWETGPNSGGCAARNRGIELARGDIVQFLDADDLLLSQKLERQVPALVAGAADIVFCNGERRDFQPSQTIGPYAPTDDTADPIIFLLRNQLPILAPLHWTQSLRSIGGFQEHLRCSQERDLHLRLACTGSTFHHLPLHLFTIRRVPGSVSSDYLNVLDQHASILWSAFHKLKTEKQLSTTRAKAFAALVAQDARHYLRYKKTRQGIAHFQLARKMHPSGGIDDAYTPCHRMLRAVIGPVLTERLVMVKRALWKHNAQSPLRSTHLFAR